MGRSGPQKILPWLWRLWVLWDTPFLGVISMVFHHWPHRDTILKSKSYTYLKINFPLCISTYLVLAVPCDYIGFNLGWWLSFVEKLKSLKLLRKKAAQESDLLFKTCLWDDSSDSIIHSLQRLFNSITCSLSLSLSLSSLSLSLPLPPSLGTLC